MTDAQLRLLLLSMLDELDSTLDDVREQMPEGAERETVQKWRVKGEYNTSSLSEFAAVLDKTKREYYTVEGEYHALNPLIELLARWRERVDMLRPQPAIPDADEMENTR